MARANADACDFLRICLSQVAGLNKSIIVLNNLFILVNSSCLSRPLLALRWVRFGLACRVLREKEKPREDPS